MKKIHPIEFAKVNVPIDKEIKNIVEALSFFPKLQTIESCQEISAGKAFVCFYYGNYWENKWEELTKFIFDFLGPRMLNVLGDNVDISVRINSNGDVYAELIVTKESVEQAVSIIQDAAQHFN